MKVGITGAAGNIGSTLRRGLKAGYDLTLFDLVEIHDAGCDAVRLDFAEEAEVRGKFEGLDAVIHLAGNPRPDVPPEVTLRNNFEATSYVFNEAQSAGVKKIIFASSNFYHEGAIGDFLRGRRKSKITLDEFPTPQSYYAQSKVYAESLGRHMAYTGMHFVALRIGWTVPEDSPVMRDGRYMRGVFLSHRDLVQLVTKALEVSSGFVAAFGVSNNSNGFFDLKETRAILGFEPEDDAEAYFNN